MAVTVIKKSSAVEYMTVVQGVVVKVPVTFVVGQTFRTIHQATQQFGLTLLPRRGWGFFPGSKTLAVWCPNMTDKKKWDNVLSSDGKYFTEKKAPNESAEDFMNRVQNNPCYGAEVLRLTFAKFGRYYHCLGIYQLDKIDFSNCETVFKRVDDKQLTYTYKKLIKTTITVVEEEVETLEISAE